MSAPSLTHSYTSDESEMRRIKHFAMLIKGSWLFAISECEIKLCMSPIITSERWSLHLLLNYSSDRVDSISVSVPTYGEQEHKFN